jgi:hypothetical protein
LTIQGLFCDPATYCKKGNDQIQKAATLKHKLDVIVMVGWEKCLDVMFELVGAGGGDGDDDDDVDDLNGSDGVVVAEVWVKWLLSAWAAMVVFFQEDMTNSISIRCLQTSIEQICEESWQSQSTNFP